MIINIRGTSGSGKSSLVRQVIDDMFLSPARGTPIVDAYLADSVNSSRGRVKQFGYWSDHPVTTPDNPDPMGICIVGDYTNECGGCDSITTKGKAQDDIQNRIRYLRGNPGSPIPANHVLFEGLLITHIYGRYRDMAMEYPDEFLFAGMDTPLEVCLQRVQARRDASGRARGPFNPDNTIKMYNDLLRVEKKCKQDGVPFVWLDHTRAYAHLMELLGL